MTKQFTLLQLFFILDGRLSTSMDDVYDILNHICDTYLMTHHLPVAMSYLKEKKPTWFIELKGQLEDVISLLCPIKEKNYDQFIWLIDYLKNNNSIHNIPQLKDEFDTSDFGMYMVDNSLLLRKQTQLLEK